MDYSSSSSLYPQQHQQRQEYEQQQQQQHPYDSYQYQFYDSSQPYYHSYQQQHQQYPYYPHPVSHTHLHYDPIHPPGVPLPPPNGIVAHQPNSDPGLASGFDPPPPAVFPGNLPIGQSPSRGGRRGKPLGGGGRRSNAASFRGGRGRGLGRGCVELTHSGLPGSSATAPPPQPPVPVPPRTAFCELCSVDCNSREILEQHMNGKKHKKKLQSRPPPPRPGTDIVLPDKVNENNNGTEQEQEQEQVGNDGAQFPGRGCGDKRKARGGGRGGGGGNKYRRGDGAALRVPAEPPKPKQPAVPLVCELCNAKCDTQAVFDVHLTGKKHQANLKRSRSNRGGPNHPSAAPPQDPQLVLAQLLMTYMVSQAQAPAQGQPDLAQNALTEEIRSQLQSLIGMCNAVGITSDASNGAPGNVVAAPSSTMVVVPASEGEVGVKRASSTGQAEEVAHSVDRVSN